MTDYINYNINPTNPDENGCYKTIAIKAGEYSIFSKPINIGGTFLYNKLNDASIMFETMTTSPAPANAQFTSIVPVDNGAAPSNTKYI